jgi:hypothetical protein
VCSSDLASFGDAIAIISVQLHRRVIPGPSASAYWNSDACKIPRERIKHFQNVTEIQVADGYKGAEDILKLLTGMWAPDTNTRDAMASTTSSPLFGVFPPWSEALRKVKFNPELTAKMEDALEGYRAALKPVVTTRPSLAKLPAGLVELLQVRGVTAEAKSVGDQCNEFADKMESAMTEGGDGGTLATLVNDFGTFFANLKEADQAEAKAELSRAVDVLARAIQACSNGAHGTGEVNAAESLGGGGHDPMGPADLTSLVGRGLFLVGVHDELCDFLAGGSIKSLRLGAFLEAAAAVVKLPATSTAFLDLVRGD